MTYTVLVRIDDAGKWPVVAREDERLLSGDGARWRFVATVDTWAEAQRLREELHRQGERGELAGAASAGSRRCAGAAAIPQSPAGQRWSA